MNRTEKILDLLLKELGYEVKISPCPYGMDGSATVACFDGKMSDGGDCFSCDGVGEKLFLQKKLTKADLEWSSSSPLARREGCGMCPYCGHSQNQGHDPECAFLDPNKTVEEIQVEIYECNQRSTEELSKFKELTGL